MILSAYAGGLAASLRPNQRLCKEIWQLKKLRGLDKKKSNKRIKKQQIQVLIIQLFMSHSKPERIFS